MPTLGQAVGAVAPIAGNVADLLIRRRGLNNATGTIQAGANQAGQAINNATNTAIGGQNAALQGQQGLYSDSVARQQPYAAVGTDALSRYRDLIDHPASFDPNQYQNEQGVKFALDQVQQRTDRISRATGQAGNGGQVRRQQRSLLDEANSLYNDAFSRFMATQKNQQDLAKGGVDIGQNANSTMDAAGKTLGEQIGANADKTGTLGVSAAEDNAALALGVAKDQAANQAQGANNTANTLGKVAGAIPSILGLFGKTAPAVGSTLGALTGGGGLGAIASAGGILPGLAAEAAPAANAALAASIGTGAAATGGTATAAGATSTAAGGGFGSTLAGLATNPITIGVAGALAAGALWLKSQAHWESNTAVKDFENPFHANSLAPFAAQWDQAIKGGKMTAQQGHDSLDQYIQNFQDYTDKIQQWAGNSKDKKKVAQQSIANLYKTTVQPQLTRMQGEISQLPVAEGS